MSKILNFPTSKEKSEIIRNEDGSAVFLDGATRETMDPEDLRLLQEFLERHQAKNCALEKEDAIK